METAYESGRAVAVRSAQSRAPAEHRNDGDDLARDRHRVVVAVTHLSGARRVRPCRGVPRAISARSRREFADRGHGDDAPPHRSRDRFVRRRAPVLAHELLAVLVPLALRGARRDHANMRIEAEIRRRDLACSAWKMRVAKTMRDIATKKTSMSRADAERCAPRRGDENMARRGGFRRGVAPGMW